MSRIVFAWMFLLSLSGAAYAADPLADLQKSLDHNKALRRYQLQVRVIAVAPALAIEVLDGDIKVRNLIRSGTDILSPQFNMAILLQAGGQQVHDAVAALRGELSALQKQHPDRKLQLTAASNTLFDQAYRYLTDGDTAKAIETFRQGAAQGSAFCQHFLGYYYFTGQGTVLQKDPVKAIEWLTRAAKQGMPEAMTCLGTLYIFEKDIPRDYTKGFDWMRQAAEMDFAPAQAMTSYLLMYGLGTAKDPVRAVEWLNKAVAQGDNYGIVVLAQYHMAGKGVPRDFEKARSLYQQVIDRNSADPKESLNALIGLASMLATAEDPRFHDGRKAVELAGKALMMVAANDEYSLYEGLVMDTLAAAYARCGQFDKAVETQETYLSLIEKIAFPPEKNKTKERRLAQDRLELYRKHQPFVYHPEDEEKESRK